MAVNVDTVYKTVLLILNKEQRGYMTPQEFNSISSQVQLQMLNEYFDDLNQMLRVPGNESEYSDHVKDIDQKLSIFQESLNTFTYSSGVLSPVLVPPNEIYKLGTVTYTNINNIEVEVQQVQPNELKQLQRSDLTYPSLTYPLYIYRKSNIYVYPSTIEDGISITYLRKPLDPIWGFYTGTRGQYIYDARAYVYGSPSIGSRNFELDAGEQTNIILRILMYAGIIIKDPSIVQIAATQVQAEQINSKA
jgi:hypothetical protein